jgi:hypothetical protein
VRLRPLLPLLFLAAACGEASELPASDAGPLPDSGAPPDAGTPDSGPPDSGPLPCILDGVPDRLEVSAGGRLIFTPTAPNSAAPPGISGPEGWRITPSGAEVRVRVPYGVEGAFEVEVVAECEGTRTTARIAVEVRPLRFEAAPTWQPGVTGPSAREHTLLFLDPNDPDRLFLFGGYDYLPRQFTLVTDFWAYNLANSTWSTYSSTGAPDRAGGRLAFIGDSGEAVVSGGAYQNGEAVMAFDRLHFAGDRAVFTPMTVSGTVGAEPSQLGSLIWDAPRQRMISACGVATQSVHCEIGALDPVAGTYQLLEPNNDRQDRPSPRYGYFAAHDLENDRLVLFAGAQIPRFSDPVNAADDTWALLLHETPVRWVKLLDADPNVPGRRNGCSAFDPIGQRFFIWGGTDDARTTQRGLFALDLEQGHEGWTKVELPPGRPERSSCTAIYDPARHRILFGFGNDDDIYADFAVLSL